VSAPTYSRDPQTLLRGLSSQANRDQGGRHRYISHGPVSPGPSGWARMEHAYRRLAAADAERSAALTADPRVYTPDPDERL
jgi:hypothetical protein